ncbi:hypothetical protein CLAIMM_09222 isoform 2, partial [Cladophialophora immunda]
AASQKSRILPNARLGQSKGYSKESPGFTTTAFYGSAAPLTTKPNQNVPTKKSCKYSIHINHCPTIPSNIRTKPVRRGGTSFNFERFLCLPIVLNCGCGGWGLRVRFVEAI